MSQQNGNFQPKPGGGSAIFPLPPNLPIAFCTLDTQGYILLLSEYAIQMLGYPSEKLIGRKLSELFHLSDEEARSQNGHWTPEPIDEASYEMHLIAGDGEPLWIRGMFQAVYNASNEIVSYFVHLLDITEIKLLKSYVEELTSKSEHSVYSVNPNAELVYSVLRANQIYEQYLDGLTDAIRGPITNISLRLHMLENDGSLESYRHVQILREQFHQVKAIVKDLLNFVDVTKNSTHMHISDRYKS